MSTCSVRVSSQPNEAPPPTTAEAILVRAASSWKVQVGEVRLLVDLWGKGYRPQVRRRRKVAAA